VTAFGFDSNRGVRSIECHRNWQGANEWHKTAWEEKLF
jgi:hypothetical protein